MKLVRFISPNSKNTEYGVVIGTQVISFSKLQEKAATSFKFLNSSRAYLAHLPESEQAARSLLEWGEENIQEHGEQDTFAIEAVRLLAPVEVVAFFDLCSLGGTDNFRGYPFGEFLDESLLSVQMEYRGRWNNRFRYTIFADAGGVASGFDAFNGDAFEAAGGIGLRYRLSKKFPLDFSIDAAINSNGETMSYVYVGQRF